MFENHIFKVVALFSALFIWYLAKQGTEPIEMSFFVPVVFKDLPPGMEVVSEPSQVNISARTTQRHGGDFKPTEVQAVLDLHNASAGTYQYVLTQDNILAPPEVNILRITPSQITINVEQLIEKILPIKPRYQGQLRQGFILEKLQVIPPTVRLRGGKNFLDSLEAIYTTEIDLQDLNSSIDMIVHLDLPNRNLQILDKEIDFYTAKITVTSLPTRRRLENVPIYKRNEIYVTRINPIRFNVYIEGPAEIVNNLKPSQIFGVIDVADYPPGNYRLDPQLILPKEINVLQQWPPVAVWVKTQTLADEEKRP